MKKPSKKSWKTPPRGRSKSKSPSPSRAGKATVTENKKKKVNGRAKGCSGEREFSHFLKERGIEARRGQQFAGGTDSPDVVTSEHSPLRNFHLEVKRKETTDMYGWLDQACTDADFHKVPAVAHRKNGKRWLVILDARDFVELVKNQATNHTEVLKAVTP